MSEADRKYKKTTPVVPANTVKYVLFERVEKRYRHFTQKTIKINTLLP